MKSLRFIILIFVSTLLNACTFNYSSTEYLKKILDSLEQIESATYTRISENWNPGDTVASNIYKSFVKEYNYPSDTTIGSKFVVLNRVDTTKLEFCYDGQMRALVYNDEKKVVLDSFVARPLPFRPLNPPFFNYVKSIIEYALTTGDSISLKIVEQDNDTYLKLIIFEASQVEFFGKAFHMPQSPYVYDNTSLYEIWIDKSNNLPYKVRREMFHNISVTTCTEFELNNLEIKHFSVSNYFPKDYLIQSYKTRSKRVEKSFLLGKNAPDWHLHTVETDSISLADIKSKVLILQFTSVSCGPCVASIQFMNEINTNYKKEDVDIIAIESTSNNTNVLRNYMNRNKVDYKFLMSTKEVLESYSIHSFPVFYILDKNHVVRKVINGYGNETTDKEIKNIINELL